MLKTSTLYSPYRIQSFRGGTTYENMYRQNDIQLLNTQKRKNNIQKQKIRQILNKIKRKN